MNSKGKATMLALMAGAIAANNSPCQWEEREPKLPLTEKEKEAIQMHLNRKRGLKRFVMKRTQSEKVKSYDNRH